MPEGVMPIQRLGLKQGEGAAQVFSFPEISRDLEYMRQRKAQDRQNELIQERAREMNRMKLIDDQLNRLDDSPLWHTNEMYFNEVTGLVDEAKNKLIDNMDKIAAGDTQALREAIQSVSYAKNRADQVGEYKKQAMEALALAKQNTNKYSDQKIQNLVDFNQGKISYDDLVEKDPNWNWYDVEDIEPLFDKFEENLSGLIRQTVSGAKTIRPGLVGVDFEPDIEEAMAGAEQVLESDPMMIADIASHYQVDKSKAKDYFMRDLRMRLTDLKDTELSRYTVVRDTGGDGKVTPDQIQKAVDLKQAVREAQVTGTIDSLLPFIEGTGYNVVPIVEGEGADEKVTGIQVFKRSVSGKAGEERESKTSINDVDLSNPEGVYNLISSINKEISMDAIRAGRNPMEGDLDAEVNRLKQEGYGGGIITNPTQSQYNALQPGDKYIYQGEEYTKE